MNQASLYQHANQVQRRDAKQIVDEFGGLFQWRTDGQDALLDIGSGSGNVLMDFVHPILPKNFGCLVGTDISKKMVMYASKYYSNYERTNFKQLDIGCNDLPQDLTGRFDHVTSFYCLHWVQKQKNALQNIYRLLCHEGDCLLVFLASNPVYEVYKLLAQSPKWSEHMQDVESFISPLQYSSDPQSEFSALLADVGFVDYRVELRNKVFIYEGVCSLKENVKAICPFLERIPATQLDDFMDDFIAIVESMNLRKDSRFISPYTLLVVYARKRSSFVSSVMKETAGGKGLN